MRGPIVLAVVLGCGGPKAVVAPPADEPVIEESLPRGGRFAPESPGAESYAPGTPPPATPLDELVLGIVHGLAGEARPLALDDRLARAAAELAAIAPGDGELSQALVEFAVQRHGVYEVSPRLFVVWGDPAVPALVAPLLRAKLPAEAFYAPEVKLGVAVGPVRDGVAPIAVVAVGSRLALAPLPRFAEAGATLTLDATLDDKLTAPAVAVAREDGETARPAVEQTGARITARIACGPQPGKLVVDVTATHPRGPIAIASFPIYCGESPPFGYWWERAQIETEPARAAHRLVALINRDRRAAGLPPLRDDRESIAAAHTHAAAQLRAFESGAAIAAPDVLGGSYSATRATGVRAAFEALANSPRPRDSMLSRQTTHVGAAVERGEGGALFVSLVYRRVPARIDREAATRALDDRIWPWLERKPYPELVDAAGKLADKLMAGEPPAEAWQDIQWWLADVRYRFEKMSYTLTIATDLASPTREGLLGWRKIHEFGLAVRQADHPVYGRNSIWIVVVTGTRR